MTMKNLMFLATRKSWMPPVPLFRLAVSSCLCLIMTPTWAQGSILYTGGYWQVSGNTNTKASPYQVTEGGNAYFQFQVTNTSKVQSMVAEIALVGPSPLVNVGGDPDDDITRTAFDTGDGYHVVPPNSTVGFTLVAYTADSPPETEDTDFGEWKYTIDFGVWYSQSSLPPTGNYSDLSPNLYEYVQVNDVPEPSSLIAWSGLGAIGLIAYVWRRRRAKG